MIENSRPWLATLATPKEAVYPLVDMRVQPNLVQLFPQDSVGGDILPRAAAITGKTSVFVTSPVAQNHALRLT